MPEKIKKRREIKEIERTFLGSTCTVRYDMVGITCTRVILMVFNVVSDEERRHLML